jgi:hypothetical protein
MLTMLSSDQIYLNLELAWKRLKQDIPHRVFIKNHLEIKIIERDLPSFLEGLTKRLRTNEYYPRPPFLCNVPKGMGLLRPGGHLCVEDRLVYYACVGNFLPNLYEAVEWSQNAIDFSYQISNNFEAAQWLRNQFVGWNNFRLKSLNLLRQNISHVLMADITGYYDTIDIRLLISDLKTIGATETDTDLLSNCLNRWAHIEGRGIPQGYTPSDLLGKMYLNNIDLNLKGMGINHLRYVDDFRIFCESEVEAKKALMALNGLLRRRGLHLQSAKTKIYPTEIARNKIDGMQPVLQPIIRTFLKDVTAAFESNNPYLSVSQADELLKSDPNEAPMSVLREAFESNFLREDSHKFDKTLFRFLLNRLGSGKDDYALSYSVHSLLDHPEETATILSYIKSIDAIGGAERPIIDFLNSGSAVYPYQTYQIIEWFSESTHRPSDDMLSICRKFAFDTSAPKYLRSVTRQMMGAFGTIADLERLEDLYAQVDDEYEKGEIVCCLNRMEKSRRNNFLSRASHDGEYVRRAVEIVKT